MKIFQSFQGVRELEGAECSAKENAIVTYELQVVASVLTDIPCDIPVGHPFRDHRESPIFDGIRNPDKVEDVGMGQILPHGDFFTELL